MFQKFRVSKNSMAKRGVSRFFVKNFLSHSAEKFRRGNHLCFRKVWVSKKFIFIPKMGISRFSIENFCLTVPKIFVGASFSASLIPGIEKC